MTLFKNTFKSATLVRLMYFAVAMWLSMKIGEHLHNAFHVH